MADIKINQSAVANAVESLLGLDSNGNLKRITIANVLGVFGVKNYGVISPDELDNCMTGWGYCSNSKTTSGCFLSVSNSECRFQIHISLSADNIYFRASNFNGDWSSWKKITFTNV